MLLSSTNIENYSVKKKQLFASIRAIGVKRGKNDNICKNCLEENMSTPRSVLITGSQRGLCPETTLDQWFSKWVPEPASSPGHLLEMQILPTPRTTKLETPRWGSAI